MTLPPPRERGAGDSPAAEGPPPLAVIAAVARNGVIGAGNRLPWHLPDDLRRFRALTTGHAVIMGRRTWESLPRALPGRQNIVVSRDPALALAGAEVASSFPAALARVTLPAPAFCIGGGELYALALPLAATLHLTEIDAEAEGDVHFPAFARADWQEVAREAHEYAGPGGPLHYAFVTYARRESRPARPGPQ